MNYLKDTFLYFFKPSPGTSFSYYLPLLVLIALLLIGAIAFSVIYKSKKKHDFAFKRLFKSLSKRLIIFGLVLLVLIAVRYENIPYFSMRLWLYLTILLLLHTAYKYIKAYTVEYPKEKENMHSVKRVISTKEENKYLPHKKKHK